MKKFTNFPLFFYAALFFLPLLAYSQCAAPQKYKNLAVNNIRAMFKTDGAHFFIESAEFEVPRGSGKTSLFATTLWLGGKDAQNNLHFAGMLYGVKGNDYYAGPVSNSGAAANTYYDKFWSLSKAEIDKHIASYAEPTYIIPQSISTWPAHGRAEYGESSKLAPYVNISGKSTYTPSQGDYPLIRGDEAIFWINNDLCGAHGESGGVPLGVEIMSMAYAYNNPDYEMQNTIFLSYEIRNKSTETYKDLYVGLFVDFDIGYPNDDYIGCDTALNLIYGYNGNEVDGAGEFYAYGATPPAQGVMFLNQKMNAFVSLADNNGITGLPQIPNDFYNYFQAKWKNGTPLTYAGSGYNPSSTDYTNFMFNGNPVTQSGWTELTPTGSGSSPNAPGERSGIMSTGPFTLFAGDCMSVDIALPFAMDMNGSSVGSVALLKQNAQKIQQFYNNQNYEKKCSDNTGIVEKRHTASLQIYPNPSNGRFLMSCDEIIKSIEIYDMLGKKVFSDTPNELKARINTDLPDGLYFYRAVLQNNSMGTGKILVQNIIKVYP